MKPFKTIVEQIHQLNDRNLTIKDKEKAKKYLLDNNYYNVINLYSKILQAIINILQMQHLMKLLLCTY